MPSGCTAQMPRHSTYSCGPCARSHVRKPSARCHVMLRTGMVNSKEKSKQITSAQSMAIRSILSVFDYSSLDGVLDDGLGILGDRSKRVISRLCMFSQKRFFGNGSMGSHETVLSYHRLWQTDPSPYNSEGFVIESMAIYFFRLDVDKLEILPCPSRFPSILTLAASPRSLDLCRADWA